MLFLAALMCWPSAGESAFCNWQATAIAGVSGESGRVLSSHYGVLTNVDCANSRRAVLEANTLVDGYLHWTDTQVGGPAVLGASITYEVGWAACSGSWSTTTRMGTTALGLNLWIDNDVSGIWTAYCYTPPEPDPCVEGTSETTTWIVDTEREPMASEEIAGRGLTRAFSRSDGGYFMDEWALLAEEAGGVEIASASSEEFRTHLAPHLPFVELPENGRRLVVEAAVHPPNHRYIPTPAFVPMNVRVDWSERSGTGSFWFRAEIAQTGAVDKVMLLESSDLLGNDAVRTALAENLRLRYADARRHRAVVLGHARVDARGRLIIEQALVTVPLCCCGEVFCI